MKKKIDKLDLKNKKKIITQKFPCKGKPQYGMFAT